MAETTSLSFPNMFNLTNNRVAVDEDLKSVTTRSRLLILSEPAELYNNPDFGVGLKRQPDVIADQTQFTDGLMFTGDTNALDSATDANEINMTVALQTTFGKQVSLDLNSNPTTQNKLTISAQGWVITDE